MCDLESRAQTRHRKDALSAETRKKLNPAGQLNWKFGGFVNENSDLSKVEQPRRVDKRSSTLVSIESEAGSPTAKKKRMPSRQS